jgi:hypothetical protein
VSLDRHPILSLTVYFKAGHTWSNMPGWWFIIFLLLTLTLNATVNSYHLTISPALHKRDDSLHPPKVVRADPMIINEPFVWAFPPRLFVKPGDLNHTVFQLSFGSGSLQAPLPSWIEYDDTEGFMFGLPTAHDLQVLLSQRDSVMPTDHAEFNLSLRLQNDALNHPVTIMCRLSGDRSSSQVQLFTRVALSPTHVNADEGFFLAGPARSAFANSIHNKTAQDPFYADISFELDGNLFVVLYSPAWVSDFVHFDSESWSVWGQVNENVLNVNANLSKREDSPPLLNVVLCGWNLASGQRVAYWMPLAVDTTEQVVHEEESGNATTTVPSNATNATTTMTESERAITAISIWGYILVTASFILLIMFIALVVVLRRKWKKRQPEKRRTMLPRPRGFPSWMSRSTGTTPSSSPKHISTTSTSRTQASNHSHCRYGPSRVPKSSDQVFVSVHSAPRRSIKKPPNVHVTHEKRFFVKDTSAKAKNNPEAHAVSVLMTEDDILETSVIDDTTRVHDSISPYNGSHSQTLINPLPSQPKYLYTKSVRSSSSSIAVSFISDSSDSVGVGETHLPATTAYLVAKANTGFRASLPASYKPDYSPRASTDPTPARFKSTFNALLDNTSITSRELNQTIDTILHTHARLYAMLQDGNKLPSWLTFDSRTATFYGEPNVSDVGEWNIHIFETLALTSKG